MSGGHGGTLGVRTGSTTGPILSAVAVPNTGGWSWFQDVSTTLSDVPQGTADGCLTFDGSGSGLFDVDDLAFTAPGPGPGRTVPGRSGRCHPRRTHGQVDTCNGAAAQNWTLGY